MIVTTDELKKIYDLFKIKSKDFKLKPNISSFDKFEEYYISNKKINISHLSCNKSFAISLQDWETLSEINNNHENNSFICIHCIDTNKLNFPTWKMKNKYDKFKEFKKYFNIVPNISSFKEYDQILNSNIKVQITHIKCNKTNNIPLNEWQFLNNKNKHFKDNDYSHLCLDCVNDKNSLHVGWEWQRKYERFLAISGGFKFFPPITNAKEYQELYEKEVLVTHIKCGRESSIILKKWMSLHSSNRTVINDDKSHLCPLCGQEKRNTQYQEELDAKYKGEFILQSNFQGSKRPVTLLHTTCNETFEIIPEHYRKNPIICRNCGKKASVLEKLNKDKINKKLNQYLKDNNLTNFEPLSDCNGISKKMKFKSKLCGHILERSPRSLLPFADKDYCPECVDLRFKSDNQEDRNSYFQSKLDETHGPDIYTLISDYTGQNTDIKVKHNQCGNEIDVYSETIRKQSYKCPYCEADTLKYSNYISLSQKMDLYEKEVNYEYKILTPFVHLKETISVKHLKCGHVFETTGNTFKKAKTQEICPECKKAARLKHALELLKKNHGDNYILLNPEDFESTVKPLKFKHKCGAVLEKTFASLRYTNSEYCTRCSTIIDSTTKLKNYAFKKFKGEYIVLGEYTKTGFPVRFRHKKCGKTFSISSKDFQNRKVPCPHCNKESVTLTIEEAQERCNNKFGNLFKICGEYINSKTEITIMCNNCSHIFPDKLPTLLSKSKCPSCKEKFLK